MKVRVHSLSPAVARGIAVICVVALAASAHPAWAAGVVTTCDEAHLDTALSGGGLVTFNCGGAATITVTSTKTISADTAIDGGSLITISGGNSVGVFSVNTGVTFTVENLIIANGQSGSGGGIANIGGTLTVTNSTFTDNNAYSGGGGGIYNTGGTLTVTDSTFAGNSASYGGGGWRWHPQHRRHADGHQQHLRRQRL